jgi:hypothetical protein
MFSQEDSPTPHPHPPPPVQFLQSTYTEDLNESVAKEYRWTSPLSPFSPFSPFCPFANR